MERHLNGLGEGRGGSVERLAGRAEKQLIDERSDDCAREWTHPEDLRSSDSAASKVIGLVKHAQGAVSERGNIERHNTRCQYTTLKRCNIDSGAHPLICPNARHDGRAKTACGCATMFHIAT